MPRGEYEKHVLVKFHAHRRWENELAPDWVTIQDLDENEIQATLQNAISLGRMKKPAHTDLPPGLHNSWWSGCNCHV